MNYQANWKKLLSKKRWNKNFELIEPPEESRSEFERDYARVVFSAAFRRLAGKTQVHPFSEIDYVHNRLTHSLEVSSVAYSLARRVGEFLSERGDIEDFQIQDVCWITQAAGLIHDIGNPPYGHAGESALQAWGKSLIEQEDQRAGAWKDIRCYDGNAQTFRMAARPDLRDTTYFRFTCASLGAVVKYPCKVSQCDLSSDLKEMKFAAFTTEDDYFDKTWEELGLKDESEDGSSYRRHPLSYLSEAADDICYRITDFEDAVLMKIFPNREIREILLRLAPGSEEGPLQNIRAKAIGRLIDDVVKVFKENYTDIIEGRFSKDLKSHLEGESARVLKELKEKYDEVFDHRKKVVVELGAFNQVKAVLDGFRVLLDEREAGRDYKSLSVRSQLFVKLAWGETYFNENRDKDANWWIHAVLDFVVGMTDGYLNELSKQIST